jgi:hypothetical protein
MKILFLFFIQNGFIRQKLSFTAIFILYAFIYPLSAQDIYFPNSLQKIENKRNISHDSDSVNQRQIRPLGLSIYGGSPALFASVSVDYFVSPDVSLEVGGGAFGFFGGGKYHFFGKTTKNHTLYAGVFFAVYGETVGTDNLFYFPVGMQYIGKKGFNFAVELALTSEGIFPGIPVWWGIKFGYRFKHK